MRHNSNYSCIQSLGATEMLQVGTSLKISSHKDPPPPTHIRNPPPPPPHTHTYMEKMASKRKKKAPQKANKRGSSHGEKKHSILVSRGRGASAYSCPPPGGTNERMRLYKMHNVFGNYSSHNYQNTLYRMHPIEQFIKNFLGRAYPRILLAIKLNSVIRTVRSTRQGGCIAIPPISPKITHPYLYMDFYP